MRIAIASLIVLFPALTFAAPIETKDKYICNCHITPTVAGGKIITKTTTTTHKVVHHHHKAAKPAQKAENTAPAPVKPKKHHVAHRATHSESVATVDKYPGRDEIIHSNKLALPAGKSGYAPGELVYVSGRVLDNHCVPVSDAIVEIWQTDSQGKFVKASMADRLSPFPTFAGTGRATTDNLGRFNFVTVFPGPVDGRAPFIHVHVVHKNFPTLDTVMFFGGDNRNATDPVYGKLDPQASKMLTAKVWQRDVNDPKEGLGASWDISLNGRNSYRHF